MIPLTRTTSFCAKVTEFRGLVSASAYGVGTDACVARPPALNSCMAKPQDPFRRLLWLASDRLFADPIDLSVDLDADPQGTLHRLSSNPQEFARLAPHLTDTDRLERHQQLITAARAYIVQTRKLTADAIDQLELGLEAAETGEVS